MKAQPACPGKSALEKLFELGTSLSHTLTYWPLRRLLLVEIAKIVGTIVQHRTKSLERCIGLLGRTVNWPRNYNQGEKMMVKGIESVSIKDVDYN